MLADLQATPIGTTWSLPLLATRLCTPGKNSVVQPLVNRCTLQSVGRWLDDADDANWDLAVIYYGKFSHNFTCAKCMHIEMGKGAKWKLVYQFTQSGAFAEHYAYRYTQVDVSAGSGRCVC